MAFPKATGYNNLPNGNFSPVIYSKQVQLAFRKSSTVEAITNSDYFGAIYAYFMFRYIVYFNKRIPPFRLNYF